MGTFFCIVCNVTGTRIASRVTTFPPFPFRIPITDRLPKASFAFPLLLTTSSSLSLSRFSSLPLADVALLHPYLGL